MLYFILWFYDCAFGGVRCEVLYFLFAVRVFFQTTVSHLVVMKITKCVRPPAKYRLFSVERKSTSLVRLFVGLRVGLVVAVLVGLDLPPSRRLVSARVRPSGLHFTSGLHEHNRLCLGFDWVCRAPWVVTLGVRDDFFTFPFPCAKKKTRNYPRADAPASSKTHLRPLCWIKRVLGPYRKLFSVKLLPYTRILKPMKARGLILTNNIALADASSAFSSPAFSFLLRSTSNCNE